MSDEYKPVSCDLHSQFELWIMRGAQIKLAWHDNNVTRIERVTPVDVRAAEGAEYLYFHDANSRSRRIRLDHVVEAAAIDGFRPLS
jgi:Rho-binding antiterminator